MIAFRSTFLESTKPKTPHQHSISKDIHHTNSESQLPGKDRQYGHKVICYIWIHMPKARFQPQVMTKQWVVESLTRNLQAQNGDDDPKSPQVTLEWLSVLRNVWVRNLISPKACPGWPHPLKGSTWVETDWQGGMGIISNWNHYGEEIVC